MEKNASVYIEVIARNVLSVCCVAASCLFLNDKTVNPLHNHGDKLLSLLDESLLQQKFFRYLISAPIFVISK